MSMCFVGIDLEYEFSPMGGLLKSPSTYLAHIVLRHSTRLVNKASCEELS